MYFMCHKVVQVWVLQVNVSECHTILHLLEVRFMASVVSIALWIINVSNIEKHDHDLYELILFYQIRGMNVHIFTILTSTSNLFFHDPIIHQSMAPTRQCSYWLIWESKNVSSVMIQTRKNVAFDILPVWRETRI